MVESASWPPGDPPDTKSFMVSQSVIFVVLNVTDDNSINIYCIYATHDGASINIYCIYATHDGASINIYCIYATHDGAR